MAAEITIPISTFDLSISYAKPEISLMTDRLAPVQALFDALAEWHPDLDDMEIITTGQLTDQGVRIRIADQKASFFFGVTACKFVKGAATWSDADETLRLLQTALTALAQTSGLQFGKKVFILSLHLQLKTASFKDILRKFISPELLKFDPSPTNAMATVVRWPKHGITIDGSAAIANGIFLKLEREFDSTESLEDMKDAIFRDEVKLLQLLGVEEIQA